MVFSYLDVAFTEDCPEIPRRTSTRMYAIARAIHTAIYETTTLLTPPLDQSTTLVVLSNKEYSAMRLNPPHHRVQH